MIQGANNEGGCYRCHYKKNSRDLKPSLTTILSAHSFWTNINTYVITVTQNVSSTLKLMALNHQYCSLHFPWFFFQNLMLAFPNTKDLEESYFPLTIS